MMRHRRLRQHKRGWCPRRKGKGWLNTGNDSLRKFSLLPLDYHTHHTHTQPHTRMYVCIYICMYVYVCMYIFMYIYYILYICIYIYIYILHTYLGYISYIC